MAKNILTLSHEINVDWDRFVGKYGIRNPQDYLEQARMPREALNFFQIGISTRCNYDCPFCFNHYNPEIGYYSDVSLSAGSIIDYFKKNAPISSVLFAVSGEPFLHPDFFRILEGIAPYVKLINISTNGGLLTRKVVDRLTHLPIGMITLSIEASDKVNYERFRKRGRFSTFLKHAEYLFEIFDRKTWVTSVLCSENADTLLGLPRLLDSMGTVCGLSIQNAVVHPLHAERGMRALSEGDRYHFLLKFLETCERFDIQPTWANSFINRQTAKKIKRATLNRYCVDLDCYRRPCSMPFHNLLVDPEGGFNFCCGVEPTAGNSLDRPVMDTFNHDIIRKMRVLNALRQFPRVCRQACHMSPAMDTEISLENLKIRMGGFKDRIISSPGNLPPWPEIDRIPENLRVLVWPFGGMGRQIILENHFNNQQLCGVVDKNVSLKESVPDKISFYSPDALQEAEFDGLIIASGVFWEEILRSFDALFPDGSKTVFLVTPEKKLLHRPDRRARVQCKNNCAE